jgi:UDP-N-acetylglucosamine 2-epimerase (non-hydrolysing)
MKLAIIVGTRPEIIRLSSTISLARKYFDVSLIHTGQNYDYNLNEIFFQDLSLTLPEYYLDCSKENLGKTVGDVISKSYELFIQIKPDAILILGDTNSCLCAYSAKRLKIPIFHLEAGNRCFDDNVPEETNRRIIDHISDYNLCYTEHARTNLLREGLHPKSIFVVGSPIPEIWENLKQKVSQSDILSKLNLEKGKYFVWSSHREENVSNPQNFKMIIECLNQVAERYQTKIIFTVHPRTRKIIEKKNIKLNEYIILNEPFGVIDYYHLQKESLCVISDSGTVTEEASILGFKAVLLRTSTEHPEGIEASKITLGNILPVNLLQSLLISLSSKPNNNIIQNYIDLNLSEKVCKIISGYKNL